MCLNENTVAKINEELHRRGEIFEDWRVDEYGNVLLGLMRVCDITTLSDTIHAVSAIQSSIAEVTGIAF